ncbi:MAG TPA: ROK family protein [Streptosporangiaceae bacterium]|nr:ROK family protein [Streptosporangiaceae bacterium]
MFASVTPGRIGRRDGDAAIGVDVGGTKVAVGLIDAASLSLLTRTTIATRRDHGGEGVLRDTDTQLKKMADEATRRGRRVVGVGLAVPEIVDLEGRITSGAVIPHWDELPVAETLGKIAPLRVEADVRAAAFAEAVLGAGRRLTYYVYLTVGTGISYSAVYKGRPVAGAHGGALNIGSSVLADLPASGSGTQHLVLERIASGHALVERYVASGGTARRAEDVLAAARHGDPLAASIVDEGARTLGNAMALLVNLLDPEALIAGGGLGSADTTFWSTAVACARCRMYSDTVRSLPILHAQLGADAGVIGAGLVGLLGGVPRKT